MRQDEMGRTQSRRLGADESGVGVVVEDERPPRRHAVEHAEPQGGSAGDAGNAQPETDNTKIDLDELAQEIYPIVKQLLEFEAERLSGKFK